MTMRAPNTVKTCGSVSRQPQAIREDGPRAAKTRARILAAAHEIFGAETYTKASLREIASRADVNVALVARYFGSKEKLFETVLDDSLTRTRLWGGKHAEFGRAIVDLLISSRHPTTIGGPPIGLDAAGHDHTGSMSDESRLAAAPSSPLLMMMHSASDRSANDVALRIHRSRVLLPLAEWLGPPDAETRAAEILLLAAGFIFHRVMLQTGHFSSPLDPRIRSWLEKAFQQIVDAGSAIA